jgi:hypothetical protein
MDSCCECALTCQMLYLSGDKLLINSLERCMNAAVPMFAVF